MNYRVPPRLAHVVDDSREESLTIFLMQLPDGPPLGLHDSAALIWALAAEGSSDVVAEVARAVGRPVEEVLAEVTGYLEDLVERGLLVALEEPRVDLPPACDTPR